MILLLGVAPFWGWSSPAHAQEAAARLKPEPLLLAPIAPTREADAPAPVRAARGERDDLPPPAARLRVDPDARQVRAEAVEEAERAARPAKRAATGDELFDYLTEGRNARNARKDGTPATRTVPTRDWPGEWEEDARAPRKPPLLGQLASSGKSDDEGWTPGQNIKKLMQWDRGSLFVGEKQFTSFVSPMSNTFLFEDPRSLTEVRPVFIYQKIPNAQPSFEGGSVWFAGAQARLAITDRFSITVNKLGVTGFRSGGESGLGNHTGLSEIWLGPKVTVIRDPDAGTILAVGAQFHVPVGGGAVYQDTGRLSIVPYATLGKSFLQTKLGSFNTLLGGGYSFSVNHERSDFFYVSGHLSYDVGNRQRFFPLMELTWTQQTTNGTARGLVGEGRDLANFGDAAKGRSLLTGALGARLRLPRNFEVGAAYELPLLGQRDLFAQRFVIDVIWRY